MDLKEDIYVEYYMESFYGACAWYYSIISNSPLFSPLSDMEFLEVLTEGLERVLMVRGGGREVITIYS